MTDQKLIRHITTAGASLFLLALHCAAQEPALDHSCTINAAWEYSVPFGQDGNNFKKGPAGFQAGGGFEVKWSSEPHPRLALYLTANFMYDRLTATGSAVKMSNVTGASSAHGSFSAVTFDPTVRYQFFKGNIVKSSVYFSGGYGWFRRGVAIDGPGTETLNQSSTSTLEKLTANSGALDAGVGVNFGITKRGALMVYAEARAYRGLAINSGTTLVPVSVGVRW
jgi:hypothetical protein